MSSTKYANAVGAVKAMENLLLTRSDIDQLINARTDSEFKSMLESKSGDSLKSVWEMLRSYAPDSMELEVLLYKNDFHNLKVALKSVIANRDPKNCFIYPSNLDTGVLLESVRNRDFESIPKYIRSTAEEVYLLLTDTLDGQLSDVVIDTACMKALQESAQKTGSNFMISYAEIITVTADIKTAYRCSKMKKPVSFMEKALCGSRSLEKEFLVNAVISGSLFEELEQTEYRELAELLKESPAKFEKKCDDMITELAETARMKSFGIDPLLAYYIAKETEIKNLRIISVCRESGADRQTVTERVRKLYV